MLSSRMLEHGVEVIAIAPETLDELQVADNLVSAPHASMARPRAPAARTGATTPGSEAVRGRPREDTEARMQRLRNANARLATELQQMRKALENQGEVTPKKGALRLNSPALVLLDLLKIGFSPQSARRLVKIVSEGDTLAQAKGKIIALVERLLQGFTQSDDIIDTGGRFTLIGPTGVGKTTTVAKLAARSVVKHGADQVALINLDSYRIGALEQLRTYGRLLGVPVLSVRSGAELRTALDSLLDKHIVLIDNTGMSQRDEHVQAQTALLTSIEAVQPLLLLNTTSRGETLEETVRGYACPRLAGCILTKVDESSSLAPAIDVVLRRRLGIHAITDGQRVPENLQRPDAGALARTLFKDESADSPWALRPDDIMATLQGMAQH